LKVSRSILALLVLALAFGSLLVACNRGGNDTTSEVTPPAEENNNNASEPTDQPVDGGTVTFAMFSAPGGVFNPVFYSDNYESQVIQFTFESLFDVADDLTFIPLLAESWNFSDDYKDLTVNLRNDVKWQDGVPFTADDVVYTYSVLADPKYNGNRSGYADPLVGYEEYKSGAESTFRGVEKVNDYQVIFHFKEARPDAMDLANYPIIPKHVYEKYTVEEMASAPETLEYDKLIGTGPFKPDKYVANESYEMVRNPDYYKGAPHLDKVIYKVVSADVAASLLETGEIDIYNSISPSDLEVINSIPGIKTHEYAAFSYQYLGLLMNKRPADQIKNEDYSKPETWTPNEKFKDKRLRQALAYAINRQGLVDGLLEGHGSVINAPFPPVSWAAASPDQLNQYPYDPEKAKALLDEAGYIDKDGDGFREDPNGNKLEFKIDYPTGNPVRYASAPIIVENLKEVGLNVQLNAPRDAGTHFNGLDFDESEMFLAGWSLGYPDPDPSGIWKTTEPYNNSRWYNQESERLLKEGVSLKALQDQNYRKEVYVQWQKLINDELPYIFLYSANDIDAYNTRIQNVQEGPLGITRDIHTWWIKNN